MMRKIGVLTSGGDSPGMNAAVMSVARSAARRVPLGAPRKKRRLERGAFFFIGQPGALVDTNTEVRSPVSS